MEIDVDQLWAEAHPDAQGLVPCVAQDLRSRAVLMVAWVSKDALARAIETGWATYYSRSRGELWEKGATSGTRQRLVDIRLDCDGDTILYLVEATLPACHLGTDTCFSRRRVGNGWVREPVELAGAPPSFASVLEDLEAVIRAREARADRPSYTRTLLEGGTALQVAKVREEAEELAGALEAESAARIASECADLVYHVAVALSAKKMSFGPVLEELARRFGNSGLDEKAGRQKA